MTPPWVWHALTAWLCTAAIWATWLATNSSKRNHR
jgi:hypothetical protein